MFAILNRYGLRGSLRLITDAINTKIFFSGCRIIRRPYYIRGKKHIAFGKNLTTGVGTRLDCFSHKKNKIVIRFGKNVQINDYVHIAAIKSITIGNDVLIASKVFISDHNHGNYSGTNPHSNPDVPPQKRPLSQKNIQIDDNVWIGEFACIMPGVHIGQGSIIGAMSVVTKSIPPYSIAVGNPAQVIKKFNFQNQKWEFIS